MKCKQCGKRRFVHLDNKHFRCLDCGYEQLTDIAQAQQDAVDAADWAFAIANVELAHYNDEMEVKS